MRSTLILTSVLSVVTRVSACAKRATRFLLLISVLMLVSCISYEPALLSPALTLSAEDIRLASGSDNSNKRIDFGLEATVNESDSLLNVAILPGVRVSNVIVNGPASAAGIQAGDIVLAINDIESNHPDVLTAIQQQMSDSNEFRFTVRRNTVVFEATVTGRPVTTNTPPRELYRADPLASRAGYRTEMVSIRNQQAVAAARVVELFPQSPLPEADIHVGDLILAVNNVTINSAQNLISRLNQEFTLGERVTVTVFDGNAVRNAELKLWDPGRRISRISLGPVLQYQSSLSPPGSSLSILDLWLFSLYNYTRVDGEKSYSILGLLNFSSNYGELTEE